MTIREPLDIVLSRRNFDPQTRTLRKRALVDDPEDTVEKKAVDLLQQAIADDESRRVQELVRTKIQSV